MLKVLWLAPNFNHYKARFLNHFAKEDNVDLTILSGTGRAQMGDQEIEADWNFENIKLNVQKKDFGKSKDVRTKLKKIISEFDWVLIPAEKKNLPLFIYAMKLRKQNSSLRLFSYNHPVLKSKNGKITLLDKLITKFYYRKLDRVVFYTEQSHDWAISNSFIKTNKAFWANNTIDNIEIDKHYNYQLPPNDKLRILFLGRLIASKRLDQLLEYYTILKLKTPSLQLEIIGDGPDSQIIKEASKNDKSIIWHGALVDEAKIAPILQRISLVFIPGHSGLSINHAFAYGRPYVTLKGPSHAPELEYIDQGVNGFVLDGDFDSNIETINNLLLNRTILETFCDNAKSKGEYLSVEKWVNQLKLSLIHE